MDSFSFHPFNSLSPHSYPCPLYLPFFPPLKVFTHHTQNKQATNELNSSQRLSKELHAIRRDAKWNQEVFQGHIPYQANPTCQTTLNLLRSQLETANALPFHLVEAFRSNILTSKSTKQFFPNQLYHVRIYSKEI